MLFASRTTRRGVERGTRMDPVIASAWAGVAAVVVLATAAVLVTYVAVKGTDSRHRAAVLRGVAEIIRALRGRR
ncbi:hypothetical protein GCM10011583_71590 [Streptomyces camponoticapitis]|uniref:DUF4244 domain-containing protein n=2 Tax=Streptomyces camponoticapitis TaxID=1616125 RepID=A0ABQ2F051_9ACTN|nr:hypothetical protein GCM10011583_71590 [Streptomyces camponoticapitis]